jgi:hypothetical protein
MSKTYRAIYEDGKLEWIGEEPGPGRHRLIVVESSTETASDDVLDGRSREDLSPEEIQQILDDARGAWGSKSADKVDAELNEMRG